MTVRGHIPGAELKGRILHNELQRAVEEAAGHGVGVAAEWDHDRNLLAVHYEYPSGLGTDEQKIKQAIRDHELDDEQEDDFQQTDSLQAEPDLKTVVASLQERLSVLERKMP